MKRFCCYKGVSILYMSRADITVDLHESKDTYSSMIVRHCDKLILINGSLQLQMHWTELYCMIVIQIKFWDTIAPNWTSNAWLNPKLLRKIEKVTT